MSEKKDETMVGKLKKYVGDTAKATVLAASMVMPMMDTSSAEGAHPAAARIVEVDGQTRIISENRIEMAEKYAKFATDVHKEHNKYKRGSKDHQGTLLMSAVAESSSDALRKYDFANIREEIDGIRNELVKYAGLDIAQVEELRLYEEMKKAQGTLEAISWESDESEKQNRLTNKQNQSFREERNTAFNEAEKQRKLLLSLYNGDNDMEKFDSLRHTDLKTGTGDWVEKFEKEFPEEYQRKAFRFLGELRQMEGKMEHPKVKFYESEIQKKNAPQKETSNERGM